MSEEKITLSRRVLGRLKIWGTHFFLSLVGSLGYVCLCFPLNFTRVLGKENVPRQSRNVLFVSNHLTMYDSVLIAVCAYYPAVFIRPSLPPYNFAAEENFFSTWYVRFLFRLLRTVPVKRGRRDPILMRRYISFLEHNNILIFYQGGRSNDLKKIKSGAAFVIAEAPEAPVVIPVYHQGMERIFRRGGPGTRGLLRWVPLSFFRRPVIFFGEPLDFSDLRRIPDKRERVETINERIVARIEKMKKGIEEEDSSRRKG